MTDLFIKRPVATTLLMAALVFFGVVSYFSLPVSEMPNIDFPTIQVTANLPGADPETMASAVATPLERQFSSISGLQSMSSVNALGSTTITLQFDLSRNLDGAGTDVLTYINAAQGSLPNTLPSPPTFQKVNPADMPIVYIRIASDSMPLYKVTDYAKTFISQRISMINGVAQVSIYGDQTYAPRVQVNPDKLAALGIGIDEVADAFSSETVMLPTGSLYGTEKLYTIKTRGQLHTAAAYNRQIITYRNGQPIRLADVGRAIDSTINDKNAAYFNQDQGIIIAVKRQAGTNTIEVVKDIMTLLPQIEATLPPSITVEVLYDRSVSIEDSIVDVQFTLLLSVALVVVVIFFFLKNIPATLIAAMALPSSIIGTLAVMQVLGFSLDNLSMMALILAVGFVVDDAIVMIENVVRHMEMGKKVMQASLDGARQIGFTIISMTLSLSVVFIPIMFMAGILGRVLNEMAVTITVAILVSGFVTLSLTPMLCSRFLSGKMNESEGLFKLIERGYEKTLHVALRFRAVVLLLSMGVLALTMWLFTVVPTGFIPATDSGMFYLFAMAEQSASFDTMKERLLRLNRVIAADPDIFKMIGVIGVGGPVTSMNNAAGFPLLKPMKDRKASAQEIIDRLRPKVAQVPDLMIFMYNPPSIQIGGKQTKALYQFTLLSPNTSELYPLARKMEGLMRKLPELADVNTDMQINGPQIFVDIDRDKAKTLGVTAQSLETALMTAYAARQVTNLYANTDTYKVIVEVQPEFQRRPDLMNKLYVRTSQADDTTGDMKLVPLNGMVSMREGVGPLVVNHTGQLTSVTISFNTAGVYSLGQAVTAITDLAKKELPPTISYFFEGQATAFQESLNSVPFLLLLAIMVIYIILGVLYESFIHPLTVLSGLPSAALGGLVTLLFFGRPLDLYGFVGIIMLIGIVKKNSIMVIDFAIEAEKEGKTPFEAVFAGCVVRFRPIMMTTVAAIAGIMPIALGYGAGGDARQPVGLVVAGGLVISQVVTLYLTPVFYTYMDELQHWLTKRSESRADAS
ncbi:efflux RND transporter permease subunit [Desulfovibrio sulfodismutans]|uniref:Efflux RND transporter permease subunit n=1 Tax=Desulfolutivibrio sulfodismutans TaxID=63561 RepID=A0A7K3NJ81_9BACT|nr:efflux RND transporter permease subunit [Desulfolutivibrio sulfodismutans]NDY56258.1 efflux RND transporter permease subunit [Desulfolutivibrio sulfodismutans]QLA11314.1 acriflavine resistance protein B [Desulfolutivibrio sulfodismutans DSM 3696]